MDNEGNPLWLRSVRKNWYLPEDGVDRIVDPDYGRRNLHRKGEHFWGPWTIIHPSSGSGKRIRFCRFPNCNAKENRTAY